MIDNEIRYWIKLLNLPNIGAKTFNKLRDTLGQQGSNISDLFQISKQELKAAVQKSKIRNSDKFIQDIEESKEDDSNEEILTELHEKNASVISIEDDLYPSKLKERLGDNTPPLIYVIGNKKNLSVRSVAIVGKRDASEKSIQIATSLAEKMANKGYNVISGYAKGIDTSAHLGALRCDGTTTIVLPLGILQFKWKEEFKKIQSFKQNSVIISQFYPRSSWQVSLAMQRNIVVIGLSDAVFVVEFNKDGGTYNAIDKSLKMGVTVFVQDTKENRKTFSKSGKKPIFTDLLSDNLDIFGRDAQSQQPEQLLLVKEDMNKKYE